MLAHEVLCSCPLARICLSTSESARYGAKDHFFNAGILHLALGDSVTVEIAVDRYCASDPKYAQELQGRR